MTPRKWPPWGLCCLMMACVGFAVAAPTGHQQGIVSYYADSLHGRRTASGAIYDKNAMTAAHRTLAFGTRVKVTNLDNGNSAIVTINDRGPFAEGRILDVSRRAAEQLGILREGLVRAQIAIEHLSEPPGAEANSGR